MNYNESTDIGVYRQENQDSSVVIQSKDVVFAAVCDGMGGHFGGKQASKLTILAFKKLLKKWKPYNSTEARKWIEEAFALAIKYMKKEASSDSALLDMGTTVTCIFIFKDSATAFNVGDSRIYAFSGPLFQVTEDHNLMNYYIKQQGMAPEKAAKIRGGAALTSALGPTKDIRVSPYELDISNVKYFILTSDGIHDYIGKSLFELLLTSKNDSLKVKSEKLIKEAIKGGSHDNLTVVILEKE